MALDALSPDGINLKFDQQHTAGGDMKFSSLEEFEKTFPPQYNLYYPDTGDGPGVSYDILMKILPEPASRIYSGKKEFELRKYVPKHTGLLFLLEGRDEPAVTGAFYFFDYIADTISGLWQKVGERATKRERFDKYFAGKDYGVALEIFDFERCHAPMPISTAYDLCPDMPRLPQPLVYMYIPVGSNLSNLLRAQVPHLVARRGR